MQGAEWSLLQVINRKTATLQTSLTLPPVQASETDGPGGSMCLTHFHFWPCLQRSSQNNPHSLRPYMCKTSVRLQSGGESQIQATQDSSLSRCFVVVSRPVIVFSLAMHLTELDQECLLHLFSYLDKDSRRSLSLTCVRLRQVFLDPQLWTLLHFRSPCELRRDNFVLSSSLRYLAVCWHSSRVKVCNIEDWMKTTFQRDLCRKHESLVSDFLERVCHMWVFLFVLASTFILSLAWSRTGRCSALIYLDRWSNLKSKDSKIKLLWSFTHSHVIPNIGRRICRALSSSK